MTEGRKGVLAIAVASAIWGLSSIYYKALSEVPPIEMLSHRTVWSVVFFGVVLALQGRADEVLGADRAAARLGDPGGQRGDDRDQLARLHPRGADRARAGGEPRLLRLSAAGGGARLPGAGGAVHAAAGGGDRAGGGGGGGARRRAAGAALDGADPRVQLRDLRADQGAGAGRAGAAASSSRRCCWRRRRCSGSGGCTPGRGPTSAAAAAGSSAATSGRARCSPFPGR